MRQRADMTGLATSQTAHCWQTHINKKYATQNVMRTARYKTKHKRSQPSGRVSTKKKTTRTETFQISSTFSWCIAELPSFLQWGSRNTQQNNTSQHQTFVGIGRLNSHMLTRAPCNKMPDEFTVSWQINGNQTSLSNNLTYAKTQANNATNAQISPTV